MFMKVTKWLPKLDAIRNYWCNGSRGMFGDVLASWIDCKEEKMYDV